MFVRLSLILLTLPTVTWAGPRQELIKQLAKEAKSGEAINLRAMSHPGLGALEQFKSLTKYDDGLWWKWGDEQMAILFPKGNGSSGVIQRIKIGEDGTVVRSAFIVPESEMPKNVRITHYHDDLSPGITRKFDTLSGEIQVSETYNAKEINKKTLRVQRDEYVVTPTRKVTTTEINGKLYLSIEDSTKNQLHRLVFDPSAHNLNGEIIKFTTDRGMGLRVHVAEGDRIVEHTFVLSPVPNSTDLDVGKRGFKVLSAEEIRKLGFLAEIKILPPRKQAKGSIRGMSVSGGTD